MRLRLSLVALGLVFLVLLGLRPDALPFIPETSFSDAALSHWPAALRIHQSGLFSLWEDTILGGQPFAANPLNKVAYPPQWLALILPPALHLNLLLVLHLLLAGWGMARWLKQMGLREEAALFGALAYALTPKVIAHLGAGHLDLLYALAWWPWLMASVRRLVQQGDNIVFTALIAALLILADLRLSLFALSLAAAYGLWTAAQNRQWSRLRWAVPVTGLVLLLTLSLTLPLLGWQPYLSRGSLRAADAGVYSLEFGQLLGLLLPAASGSPETMIYLGLPVLLLAGIGLLSGLRKHWFWGLALLLALLYALGINGPLWPLLVNLLPPLLWFRVPARAWFVVLIAACVLASYGLEALMNTVERLRNDKAVAWLVLKRLAIAGGIGGSLFCGGFTLAVLSDLPGTVGLGVMLIGGLTGILLLLAFYGRLRPASLASLLTLVLFLDIACTGHSWLEWREPESWLTQQAGLVDALKAEIPARIYSPDYALQQQVAAANDLRLFYGVDPFQLTGIVKAIAQGSGVPVTKYSVILPPLDVEAEEDIALANQKVLPDTQVLADWDVSHVIADYPMVNDRLELKDQVGATFIYANLDYAPSDASGWPRSWPDLPDEATVQRLNQITQATLWFSAACFGLALVYLLWRRSR